MLALMKTFCPARGMGLFNDCKTLSITMGISSTLARSCRSIANSSPPNRATVSPSLRAWSMRPATVFMSSSPDACPSVSFTTLKLSRSKKRTAATVPLCHCPLVMTWLSLSIKSILFGSPVRLSWYAISRITPSIRILWDISSLRAMLASSRSAVRSFTRSSSSLWAFLSLTSASILSASMTSREPSILLTSFPSKESSSIPSAATRIESLPVRPISTRFEPSDISLERTLFLRKIVAAIVEAAAATSRYKIK